MNHKAEHYFRRNENHKCRHDRHGRLAVDFSLCRPKSEMGPETVP